MKDRRGFTLVELLAVIVILSGLSLLVAVSINSTLERRDEKEVAEQVELAKNAAKIYFSLNGGPSVSIEDLIDGDYLDDNKIDKLERNKCIVVSENKYSYDDCNS